jgi:hypothetical protein
MHAWLLHTNRVPQPELSSGLRRAYSEKVRMNCPPRQQDSWFQLRRKYWGNFFNVKIGWKFSQNSFHATYTNNAKHRNVWILHQAHRGDRWMRPIRNVCCTTFFGQVVRPPNYNGVVGWLFNKLVCAPLTADPSCRSLQCQPSGLLDVCLSTSVSLPTSSLSSLMRPAMTVLFLEAKVEFAPFGVEYPDQDFFDSSNGLIQPFAQENWHQHYSQKNSQNIYQETSLVLFLLSLWMTRWHRISALTSFQVLIYTCLLLRICTQAWSQFGPCVDRYCEFV